MRRVYLSIGASVALAVLAGEAIASGNTGLGLAIGVFALTSWLPFLRPYVPKLGIGNRYLLRLESPYAGLLAQAAALALLSLALAIFMFSGVLLHESIGRGFVALVAFGVAGGLTVKIWRDSHAQNPKK